MYDLGFARQITPSRTLNALSPRQSILFCKLPFYAWIVDFYGKVTDFKKQGKKVLIAIGGWNDSKGDKYSRLVNNPASRAKFITHVIEWMIKYNFDGLDLDWEYPKCWQVSVKTEIFFF